MQLVLKAAVKGQAPHAFIYPNDEIVVGRVPANDLVLPHGSVSEQHARIARVNGELVVTDLRSHTGTFIDERRIVRPTAFRPGDVVRIGAYEVRVLEHEVWDLTELGFLEALEANPHDDETRQVYADWLEEQDRKDAADFLRVQLTLKDMAPEHPRFQGLARALSELAPQMRTAWRRTVARPPIENCNVRFELQCPKKWDELAPTNLPDVRHCNACKKNVHFARDIHEARRLAMANHCIAVDLTVEPRFPGDLEMAPIRMAGGIAPPPFDD